MKENAPIALDDDFSDDALPEITTARPSEPTGWTERDRRLFDRAMDLASVTDPAERARLSLAANTVVLLILTPMVYGANAHIEGLKNTLARVAAGDL